MKHVGITDEEAWADAAEAGKSYRNDDSALSFAGYAFAADGTAITAKDGVTSFVTDARAIITGDGKTVLVLYFKPLLNTITFNFGSGTSTGAPATMQVYTDQTVELSSAADRTGYELAGWSNVPTYSVKVDGAATATTVNVGTSTGLASQAAADAAKANTKRTSDKGAAFTAVVIGGQTLYLAPTDASITLYATWRAKSDTVFYVDRYKITGDGVLVPIDAAGNDLAAVDPLRFTGVTDELATAGAHGGPKPEHQRLRCSGRLLHHRQRQERQRPQEGRLWRDRRNGQERVAYRGRRHHAPRRLLLPAQGSRARPQRRRRHLGARARSRSTPASSTPPSPASRCPPMQT